MRRILLILCLTAWLLPAAARSWRTADVPNVQLADRTRFTANPDGLLSAEAVRQIDSICGALRSRNIAQVAVVAVDDIEGGDPFSFAIDLFDRWGVGQAGDNNGLGILLVERLHEIRFVTGGGLEGVLPDALCKRIQMTCMLPRFREGDYSGGMVAGVEAVAQLLVEGELDFGEEDGLEIAMAILILLIIIAFAVMVVVAERQRRNNGGNDLDDMPGGGIFLGGFGRGFGGGGSSLGGGFGGGSFGGGGAGSRW